MEDNLIIYFVGPIKVSISGWSEEIVISTDKQWEYLLKEIPVIIEEAWSVDPSNIVVTNCRITVKLNYTILKLYIEHVIVFL